MRLLLFLAACGADPAPTSPADLARALPPESDAVPPLALAPRALPHGTVEVVAGRLRLDGADVLPGELIGRPSVSAAGDRVLAAHRLDDGDDSALTLLGWDGTAWRSTTVLTTRDEPDRVALHPDGTRAAFVWAGPDGGVAGVWTIALPSGTPVRRTNGGARVPGRPPDGFVPLPVQDPPRWDKDRLTWRSEQGEHAVEVPR